MMRLLARREYTCQPWRNGGGETAEIAVRPGAGSDFLWRLSLATITRSGPFSTFPGVSRIFTLVEGGLPAEAAPCIADLDFASPYAGSATNINRETKPKQPT